MTPTSRSGTLSNGTEAEDGRWEMGDGETSADFADGADFEISDFGFAICDCGEAVTADVDDKPIFKGAWAAGKIWTGTVGEGFSFSGKFGSARVEISGADFISSLRLFVSALKFAFDFSGSV